MPGRAEAHEGIEADTIRRERGLERLLREGQWHRREMSFRAPSDGDLDQVTRVTAEWMIAEDVVLHFNFHHFVVLIVQFEKLFKMKPRLRWGQPRADLVSPEVMAGALEWQPKLIG